MEMEKTLTALHSDLLRRHVARHAAAARPASRRRQACDACRANKSKCEGTEGPRCMLCTQRAIDCTYLGSGRTDTNDRSAIPVTEPLQGSTLEEPQETSVNWPPIFEETGDMTTPIPAQEEIEPSMGGVDTVPTTDTPPDVELNIGNVGATFLLNSIQNSADIFENPLAALPVDMAAWCASSTEAYWEQVHGHWSMFHSPTFSLETRPLSVTASVMILGRWFSTPSEYSRPLFKIHERLVDLVFEKLVRHLAVILIVTNSSLTNNSLNQVPIWTGADPGGSKSIRRRCSTSYSGSTVA